MRFARCRWSSVTALLVALSLALTSAFPVSAVTYPNSMAALGDSITRAYNTGSAFADAPQNAWATGTNSSVNSLYLRLLPYNAALSGKNFNYAVTSAKMASLATQAGRVTSTIQYVTILMGANDVCTSSESTMTSVAAFQSQFTAALNLLKTNAPNAQIYVVSIPNIYNLWAILKGSSTARFTWSVLRICQSMLANASSTSSTDEARRQRVRQRNIDFNSALAQVCAQYANCRFDNNAVFNTTFVKGDVSTRDYFHPSLAGQVKLANVAWGASGFAAP
ncbi:MAG: SGNH/GDSL hydrolase family protein [Anaerolineales bacterium]|nr:SGNH/GDSL hydrolase family protein [Anaerolineales bacterium]